MRTNLTNGPILQVFLSSKWSTPVAQLCTQYSTLRIAANIIEVLTAVGLPQ